MSGASDALPVDEGASEGDPALVPAFARKGMLHITQCGLFGCVGIRARQTCSRLWIALAQRFQPTLGSLAEIVDGGHGRLLPISA